LIEIQLIENPLQLRLVVRESDNPVPTRITSHTDEQHEKDSALWNASTSKYHMSLWQFSKTSHISLTVLKNDTCTDLFIYTFEQPSHHTTITGHLIIIVSSTLCWRILCKILQLLLWTYEETKGLSPEKVLVPLSFIAIAKKCFGIVESKVCLIS